MSNVSLISDRLVFTGGVNIFIICFVFLGGVEAQL